MERVIYDSLFKRAKHDYESLNLQGLVGKRYTHILAMLMKLRRAVLHPSLVFNAEREGSVGLPSEEGAVDINKMIKQFAENEGPGDANDTYMQEVLSNLNASDAEECPICLDVMETPMIIPICMHKWSGVCTHNNLLSRI